nr:M24 family metallopeptidase [Mesorhizobium sp.]
MQGVTAAEAAVTAAYDVIAPGVRECDAIARIQAAQIAGSPDFAGDITALPPTVLGGENASAPHIMWSDRRFGANETVALELAGAVRHYTAGLARTLQLGPMPAKVNETSKAVIEGMEAVLATIGPGVIAQEVEDAWRKVIQRYGLKKESRIGYSIGVGSPRIGASTQSASGRATRLCSGLATSCIPSSASGWTAGASRSARRSSSPPAGMKR